MVVKGDEPRYSQDFRRELDNMINQRLQGIEHEQRELRTLVERVVGVEERMVRLLEQSNNCEIQQVEIFKRLRDLEISDAKVSVAGMGAIKAFWIITGAAASIIVGFVTSKITGG